MTIGPIPGKPKPADNPTPIAWKCSGCGNKAGNFSHYRNCASCGELTAPKREAA